MTIIDILTGKERPDKFMYDSLIYTRKANGGYIDDDGDNLLEVIFDDYSNINDEVKAIEEEPKPLTKQDVEALGYACGEIKKCFTNGWNKSLENKPLEEENKIEKSDFQYSEIPPYFDLKQAIKSCNNNFEKHQKAINKILDYLMENKQ